MAQKMEDQGKKSLEGKQQKRKKSTELSSREIAKHQKATAAQKSSNTPVKHNASNAFQPSDDDDASDDDQSSYDDDEDVDHDINMIEIEGTDIPSIFKSMSESMKVKFTNKVIEYIQFHIKKVKGFDHLELFENRNLNVQNKVKIF